MPVVCKTYTWLPLNSTTAFRVLLCLFPCICTSHVSGQLLSYNFEETNHSTYSVHATVENRFNCFFPLDNQAQYSIELCADVPDNDHPEKVYVKKETGHVFLILRKIIPGIPDTLSQVFGFYPRRPASSLIFKNVRSELLDNGNREYNISIFKELTVTDFEGVLVKATKLGDKKYNLNKFNCYDYAVEIYNSIRGIEKIPVSHIKYPFIAGRGGSPCGLYKDLQTVKKNKQTDSRHIKVGQFMSPISSEK